ncbi:MAG: GNAT family N-acetyltransferase [Lachnospiraceae bacterium]|uniref:GNAT family N-acetyltransferase n=1 Tax=Ruminococcus sp. TaxID=41978 RepID=UPI002E80C560|nr:GNAT family N-acetyltransferase [Ruminococcus sp.]MBQ5446923.1 GNAT family N-acetyltransferase [Lachnospiraceae bacterium]MEE3440656.1 GNAT family N-acetyltransferase [Ruminococcus sp.]
MIIRKARGTDASDLKVLYFEYLTHCPPEQEQDMTLWQNLINKFEEDKHMYLLVVEEEGKVVSSVQMAIIESLTHNVRPFAIIENVVTHKDYWKRGFASALLERATEIAREHNCYKVFLETGSNRESTLNFYKNNGFVIDEKHSCLKHL